MKPVTEYFLLQAMNPSKLAEMVNTAIKENKQPFGYPFVVSAANVVNFCQAMAFYNTDAPDL